MNWVPALSRKHPGGRSRRRDDVEVGARGNATQWGRKRQAGARSERAPAPAPPTAVAVGHAAQVRQPFALWLALYAASGFVGTFCAKVSRVSEPIG